MIPRQGLNLIVENGEVVHGPQFDKIPRSPLNDLA